MSRRLGGTDWTEVAEFHGPPPASGPTPPIRQPGRSIATSARPASRRRLVLRPKALVGVLVGSMLLGFWLVALRPTFLGGSATVLFVRGISMEPTYHSGDLVIAYSDDSPSIGDIVAFHVPKGDIGEGAVVIHRVVSYDPGGWFITRGDNNGGDDPWRVSSGDVIGVARWHLPAVGKVRQVFHSHTGISMLSGTLSSLITFGAYDPERGRPSGRSRARRRRRR